MDCIRMWLFGLILGVSLALTGCGDEVAEAESSDNTENNDESNEDTTNTDEGGESQTDPGDEVDPDPNDDPEVEPDPNDDPEVDPDPNDDPEVDPDPNDDPEVDPDPNDDTQVDLNAMKIGDEWRLELVANASTGYEWMMQPGMDESVLVVASSEYVQPEDTGAVGVGGAQVFVFRAVGTGTTSVLIHYARSWEPEFPADQYTFDVTVVE